VTNDSLVLLGAVATLWASSNTFLTLHQELNRIRDAVFDYPPPERSLEHRYMLLTNDWIPLWVFTVLLCFGFGVSAVALVGAIGPTVSIYAKGFCVFLGTICWCVAGLWLIYGRRDLMAMRKQLKEAKV
jgi:uncharacterized BrkB/YihY/UPF0761 family membrane protein